MTRTAAPALVPAPRQTLPTSSVSRLAVASSSGEPEAPFDPAASSWDEIVRAHRGQVYRQAYRLTRNRQDAEDLTQDVFVRVFHALPNYRPGGSFPGWLHRITTNLFRDSLRRSRRIRVDALGDDTDRLVDRSPSPAELLDDRTLNTDVADALAALPSHFRSTVLLRDLHGLPYDQVAAILGIKVGTVRSRLHRGRAQLRTALAHRARRPALAPAFGAVAPAAA